MQKVVIFRYGLVYGSSINTTEELLLFMVVLDDASDKYAEYFRA